MSLKILNKQKHFNSQKICIKTFEIKLTQKIIKSMIFLQKILRILRHNNENAPFLRGLGIDFCHDFTHFWKF